MASLMDTSLEDLPTFISSGILHRIRNVSDQSCTNIHNIHFMVNTLFFLIMPVWDNVEEYGTARQVPNGNIIQHMKDVIWMANN